MDHITLCDLEVRYRVGITAEERAQPQLLLLRVEMDFDLSRAGAKDDLTHTINYQAVVNRLLSFGEQRQWNLIETVATDLAQAIIVEFSPESVTLEVKKFIIPQTRYVSVTLTRNKPHEPGR